MNWKIIFNPFSKFSETTLLVLGIILTLIGSFIGSYFGIIYDGVSHMNFREMTFGQSLLANVVILFSLFIVLFALGKIFNSKTRAIDILNTAFISRLPMYLLATFANNDRINSISEKLIKSVGTTTKLPISQSELSILMIFSLCSLLLLAYEIVLQVFGFKTATNIKKWQYWVVFGISLIVAEIISRQLINLVLPS